MLTVVKKRNIIVRFAIAIWAPTAGEFNIFFDLKTTEKILFEKLRKENWQNILFYVQLIDFEDRIMKVFNFLFNLNKYNNTFFIFFNRI